MLVSMMLSPERHPTMAGCQKRALRANRASHAGHASQEHEPGCQACQVSLSAAERTRTSTSYLVTGGVGRRGRLRYVCSITVLARKHASRHMYFTRWQYPPGKKSSTGTSSMLISLQDAATRSPPPPSPPPPPPPGSPSSSHLSLCVPSHPLDLSLFLLPPPSAVCRNPYLQFSSSLKIAFAGIESVDRVFMP